MNQWNLPTKLDFREQFENLFEYVLEHDDFKSVIGLIVQNRDKRDKCPKSVIFSLIRRYHSSI